MAKTEISNPDKVLFPKSKIKKKELIDYYSAVANKIIPYMEERPIAMKRFVNGISKEGFFQKEAGEYFPSWIKRVRVKKETGSIEQVVVNKKETLKYLANQDVIEFHLFLSNLKNLEKPDKIIFDLDAGEGQFKDIKKVALAIREELDKIGAKSYVMTTGSRGLHVVVPIRQNVSFSESKKFALDIAKKIDGKTTLEIRKEKRGNRVFIDILRNNYAQLSVSPYSVRAKEGAPIAMPISWSELSGLKSAQQFNIFNSLQRKDAWQGFGKKRFDVGKMR